MMKFRDSVPTRRDRNLSLPVALLLALILAAAEPAMGAPAPPEEEIGDLRETIQLLMLSRLKRALDLSPEQEQQVLPLLDHLEQSRQQLRRQNRRATRELRRLLEADAPEERLEERLQQVRELRRGFEAERQRIEEEIARQLTPHQQARLLVFMQDFRRRLHERLSRHRDRLRQSMPPEGRRRYGRRPEPEEPWPDDPF
ncbi:MAG: hypothetical protein V3U98_08975 [Acidobacteriota bacterium]